MQVATSNSKVSQLLLPSDGGYTVQYQVARHYANVGRGCTGHHGNINNSVVPITCMNASYWQSHQCIL